MEPDINKLYRLIRSMHQTIARLRKRVRELEKRNATAERDRKILDEMYGQT